MTYPPQRAFWNDFRSALLFITIIPAGRNVPFSPVGMIRFFPLVGLVIGLILAVFDAAAAVLWPRAVVALLDVLVLAAVTGAFHLDGLGDAADGLFSHRSRERALEIMKDSRTGMMGLVAIFFILAIKTAGLYAVMSVCSPAERVLVLSAVPALARSSMLPGIRLLPYGRGRAGTGHDLFETRLPLKDFIWTVPPLIVTLMLGVRGVVVLVFLTVTTGLLLLLYHRKMRCITGDMLGAMTEVTEAVLFLAAGIMVIPK